MCISSASTQAKEKAQKCAKIFPLTHSTREDKKQKHGGCPTREYSHHLSQEK